MAKVIPAHLTLDDEVSALVQRIGALPNPKNQIREYKVDRLGGDPAWVTVTFLADEQFCKPPQDEVTGQESLFEKHADQAIKELSNNG